MNLNLSSHRGDGSPSPVLPSQFPLLVSSSLSLPSRTLHVRPNHPSIDIVLRPQRHRWSHRRSDVQRRSMVAAAQLGALAACIVLFVPMGMAGWHLSRNKMLFFSGALFITLAVGVHIAPYFPAASQFLISTLTPSFSSSPPFRPSSCLSFVHDVSFLPADAPSSFDWFPIRSRSADCGFQKLSRSDAGELLNGSWILVAGDSQARLFVLSLLRLLLDRSAMEAVEGDLFRRHSDYQIMISEHGVKLDFVWSPFESNITSVLQKLRGGPRLPEVLVAGSGLWHMLHVNNASDYGENLASVRRSAASMVSPFSSGLAMQPRICFGLAYRRC
ncbi:hypothetical protein M5K25_007477 [Dendrobium thyrsiflorum]|uniref:Uncharacterized protein n=1 Tax=Dendrobium thyrsiflorum TaxID=117978 RepID=A0ABD0VLC5_DENTH